LWNLTRDSWNNSQYTREFWRHPDRELHSGNSYKYCGKGFIEKLSTPYTREYWKLRDRELHSGNSYKYCGKGFMENLSIYGEYWMLLDRELHSGNSYKYCGKGFMENLSIDEGILDATRQRITFR
jgi:hypothetical protein